MSRLVVQHPTLSELTVQVFSAAVGAKPAARSTQYASWDHVAIDGEQVTTLAKHHRVDAEITAMHDSLHNYRLLAFDMDSTLITIECIDEIADFAGRKEQVAAITEATMRGEISSFSDSLRQRVELLKGLPSSVLQRVFDERLQLSNGAAALINRAHEMGLKTLLVSGGFTYFTSRLQRALGFEFALANTLEIINDTLTGRVLGPIIDAEAKRRTVLDTCQRLSCQPEQSIVIGDGANDLKMMSVAGVSVAYHAKPIVRSETTHSLNYCGLDAVLNFFDDGHPTSKSQ